MMKHVSIAKGEVKNGAGIVVAGGVDKSRKSLKPDGLSPKA